MRHFDRSGTVLSSRGVEKPLYFRPSGQTEIQGSLRDDRKQRGLWSR
jgi:hypothetical protein